MNETGAFVDSDKEIIRFDVTMDKELRVDVLNAREHLISDHEGCLQGEASVAEVEQIF